MKPISFLIPIFAAALTVGTCGATQVVFSLNGNSGPFNQNQFASLSIDGALVGSGSGTGSTPFVSASLPETDGWHTISIDYKNFGVGPSGLTLLINGGWALLADLQSLDASGTPTNGLRGDFLTISGTPLFTVYGASEGPYLVYTVGSGPWSTFSSTSTFEEILTGKIYFGSNGNPPIDTITSPPPNPPADPPVGGGTDAGTAPEPASWWLGAVALPLMMLSKLRKKRVSISQ